MTKVICFDLDDTLSKEIAYLKSAYRAIVHYAVSKDCSIADDSAIADEVFQAMMAAYYAGDNAFEALNAALHLDLPISDYLNIYRNHVPQIALSAEVEQVLAHLKEEGFRIGLITDGRSVQQRHKIEALVLGRFIDPDDMVISEEFGSEKPAEANYRYFMERYADATKYIYVGDNPKKDFVTPNRLGWQTVGLLDNGENIHKQATDLSEVYQPQTWIDSLSELLALVC